jgi:glycosyltransferase involved in cell wall biosynthesis
MTPRVSVIVCTHDRPAQLRRCLRSVGELNDPVEVIVVDSASLPPVRSIVEEFESTVDVRYAYERRPGLSTARNLGLKLAGCPIVAFLDDDARPRPDWAGWIHSAYDDPGVACVGGACIADFCGRERPGWLSDGLLRFAGITTFPHAPFTANRAADYPFGANISFRRDLLLEAGGFDPALGRTGTTLLSGEDFAAINAIRAAGGVVRVEPRAVVDHEVAGSRLESSYYWRRLWWEGRTRARMSPGWRRRAGLVIEAPLHLARYARSRDRHDLLRATAETCGHVSEWWGHAA